MTNFEKVKQFMQTFGQEVKTKASFSDEKTNQLRLDLISEELEDLKGDSTKLRKLGWKPDYTFETMIDEMIEYWMEVL